VRGTSEVAIHTEFWRGKLKEGKNLWEDNIKMDVKEIK
jgi:hypothetical protein